MEFTEKQIEDILRLMALNTKEVLTSEECALYLGVSKSCLYKWTMDRKIPHYKSPTGKMCFFNRKEVEQWCQMNKIEPMYEDKPSGDVGRL